MHERFVLAAIAALTLASGAYADDIRVPQDEPTLEAAAAAARSGDRIVLRRGSHDGGVLAMDGVSIVGRGATIRGTLNISGDANAVSGVTFRDGSLTMTGTFGIVDRCRFKRAWVQLVGNSCKVTQCRIFDPGRTGAEIIGHLGEIRGVRASRLEGAAMLRIFGDAGLVERNRVSVVYRTVVSGATAIVVEGTGAEIRFNRVRRCSRGIHVEGERFSIDENNVEVRGRPGTPKNEVDNVGIVAIPSGTPGGGVRNNTIRLNRLRVERGAGIRVVGTGGTDVAENRIRGRIAPVMAIFVQSDENGVTRNHATARPGVVSSAVVGDRNIVRENTLRELTVTGTDNVVEDNAGF